MVAYLVVSQAHKGLYEDVGVQQDERSPQFLKDRGLTSLAFSPRRDKRLMRHLHHMMYKSATCRNELVNDDQRIAHDNAHRETRGI